MSRLLATMRWDTQLQYRYGFYYAGVFVTVLWVLLLRQLPHEMLGLLFPPFLFLSLNITTYYFIGGLVLFEKGEGVLEGLVVSPLRIWEYLSSKVVTLTLLASAESMVIIALVYGFSFQPFFLLVGMVLLGAMYTLIGFIAVARYDSINEYLMPSSLFVAVLQLPLVHYFGLWESWIFYLFPTQGPLLILKAAFLPVAPWEVVYGVIYSLLWIGMVYSWSHRSFHQFIIRTAGSSS